jgi:hypothetical protein
VVANYVTMEMTTATTETTNVSAPMPMINTRLRQCPDVTPERTLCEDCRVLREVVAE